MTFRRILTRIGLFLCLIAAAVMTGNAGTHGSMHIEYQSPVPGALYITPETNVILRMSDEVDAAYLLSHPVLNVSGSISGAHTGTVRVVSDGRTILFKPCEPFSAGETVVIAAPEGIRSASGFVSAPIHSSCSISKVRLQQGAVSDVDEAGLEAPTQFSQTGPEPLSIAGTDTLPLDFPYINTTIRGAIAPGKVFLSNFKFFGAYAPYLLIVDNLGSPIFYRKMPSPCLDFKVQPNGLLTYFQRFGAKFYAMDSSYTVVDSFTCGNGYTTDLHELRILPNGHALLMSYDVRQVDMSQIVPGGKNPCAVTGLIIQELDENKDVVFQWRSWDYFQITDATHENLDSTAIDYAHGNAIEYDSTDGNIIISSRHMDEITKISRTTGDIIWRMGGKNNQFTFVGDTIGFSHQHAVRRIANGHMTLFDNGNYHHPAFSRALEFQLDEQNKIATLVWQYRNSPDIYGTALGYVQRLANGNTLIGWGATNPSVTEVSPAGGRVYELTLAPTMYSYRAFRYPWKEGNSGGGSPPPKSYILAQNYPNPFSKTLNQGKTIIQVSLPEDAIVSFKIYDVLGRLINNELDGEPKNRGNYQLTFNGSGLPTGVYFYRLQTPHAVETRKMQLIR